MTNKTVSDTDFSKLITQANLILSDDQKKKIHSQLDEALSASHVLNELDTSKVGNATSASGLTNVLREDVVKPSFSQAEALSNASTTHKGYFVVKAVFENQDN